MSRFGFITNETAVGVSEPVLEEVGGVVEGSTVDKCSRLQGWIQWKEEEKLYGSANQAQSYWSIIIGVMDL
ncbi:hypothetical protein PPACK8108_LOCUS9782 [Phakopsora pachyrhizi]|uniref:Uncharacterized protein n=1 Tax=Phakopsora pachyrhizi TaxID=170000 RepID=A0AAV0AYQ7_PHAPC|nr:hypothetical protein PPACK8108_LOCUS9782 [Phakopsora pachyrhizi]